MPTLCLRLCCALFAIFLLPASSAQESEPKPIRVACVGDSITQGYGNPDHRVHSWPMLLQGLLDQDSEGRFRVGNFARGGATLLPGTRRPYREQPEYEKSLNFAPDVVLINLGINDSNHGFWDGNAEVFRSGLVELIGIYRDLPSEPEIILSSLTCMFPPNGKWEETRGFRDVVDRVVGEVAMQENLRVADFSAATREAIQFMPDGLHPNTAGNGLLARAAFTALMERAAPEVLGLRPREVAGAPLDLLAGAYLGTWVRSEDSQSSSESVALLGTGSGNLLFAGAKVQEGDFHMRARIRMLGQENSAAHFFVGENVLGFEGSRGRAFRNGPRMGGGLRLLHPSPLLWERDAWIDFEVIRNGEIVWFLVDDFVLEMAQMPGPLGPMGFEPMRSRMQVAEWSLVGASTPFADPGPGIPLVDLAGDDSRVVVVDREAGQYLGHVSTQLLEDGKTILAVYPKGHGKGAICYKKSEDGGRNWSERLPTPESWQSSLEVPTIHRVIDPKTQDKALILWSGLYPARLARSEDDGRTWSELEPVGTWGGIVVMGFVERLKDGRYLAMFHDDGRFFSETRKVQSPVVFSVYQTISENGGRTWSDPQTVWSGSDLHLCEPGCIRSPDGKTLAVLFREKQPQVAKPCDLLQRRRCNLEQAAAPSCELDRRPTHLHLCQGWAFGDLFPRHGAAESDSRGLDALGWHLAEPRERRPRAVSHPGGRQHQSLGTRLIRVCIVCRMGRWSRQLMAIGRRGKSPTFFALVSAWKRRMRCCVRGIHHQTHPVWDWL